MNLKLYKYRTQFKMMFTNSLVKKLVLDSLDQVINEHDRFLRSKEIINKHNEVRELGFATKAYESIIHNSLINTTQNNNDIFLINKDVLNSFLKNSPKYVLGSSLHFMNEIPEKNMGLIKKFPKYLCDSSTVVQYSDDDDNVWINLEIKPHEFVNNIKTFKQISMFTDDYRGHSHSGWVLDDSDFTDYSLLNLNKNSTHGRYRCAFHFNILSNNIAFKATEKSLKRKNKISNVLDSVESYHNVVLFNTGHGYQVVTAWKEGI
jgi:hypothetical protein